MVTQTINGGAAVSSPVVRSKNVLKRNSIRFRAALLAVLASFVAGPNAALDAAPEHRDQVPGFYRLKVGRQQRFKSETKALRTCSGVRISAPTLMPSRRACER
jgi:hypothetical protein